MVTEYLYDRCRYLMGSMKPCIYLLPRDNTRIDYLIDNFKCEVKNIIAGNIMKIEGSTAKLTVTETVDNRLDFKTDVTLQLRETWGEPWCVLLNQLKSGNYYVVVEDSNGIQYIQSPEFTSEFTYTYNFDTGSDAGHIAELKFSCQCNNPVIILDNTIGYTTLYTDDCSYSTGGVVEFRMSPYQYVLLESDRLLGTFSKITCTQGEAMHKIEFTPKTFQFRQQYDGKYYQERLTFQIPLSDYKYYWRYNLAEFNENKYAVAFKTTQNNWIATGFEFGMQPTYTIETTDASEELNAITITLQHMSQNSLYYCSDREPQFVDSTTNKFVPVTQPVKDPVTGEWLGIYHCTSKTTALYTLVQMVTESGVPTDRYMCLQGYEELYKNLNIIGTYTKDADFGFELEFENYDCAIQDNCKFNIMSDDIFVFSKRGDLATLTVRNPCPWELKELPAWLEADIMSGDGGLTYTIEFSCQQNAKDYGERNDTGYIQSFDNVTLLHFILQDNVAWINPATHRITAKAQSVFTKVSLDWDDYEVCDVPPGLTAEKVYGQGGVRITVPENTSESAQLMYQVKLCSRRLSEEAIITIIQDRIYVRWVKDPNDVICVGNASYEKLIKYKGYTADDINIYTGESRAGALISEYDSKCMGIDSDKYRSEWVDVEGTICNGRDLYSRQQLRESFDSGVTWQWTDQYRLGHIVQSNSSECQEDLMKFEKWVIDYGETICVGNDSYFIEVKYWSYDEIAWYESSPRETRQSGVMRKMNDTLCGGTQVDPSYAEKWEDTSVTECIGGFLHYLQRLSISTDGGQTWQQTDQYRLGERTTTPCESRPESDKHYVWVIDFQKYICDGKDAKYVEVKYYYYIEAPDVLILAEPYEERASDIVKQANSKDCGGDGESTEPIYRWNTNTGVTECDGYNLYTRVDYEVSNDSGRTWQKTGQWKYGTLLEEDSDACKSQTERIYRWKIDNSRFACVGTDSYYLAVRQYSDDGGATWYNTDPEETMTSNQVKQYNDSECGVMYRWVDTDEYICADDSGKVNPDIPGGTGTGQGGGGTENPEDTVEYVDTGEYICVEE